jgi:hypothetical protein
MATVTPNFNWPVPTSTDLVKDGATAIEALGDSIDASLVDLKGGTTGQVLSKNSNTDMDFVWVTDAAGDITGVTAGTGISGGGTSGTVTVTNSMATAIDAKGDLVPGTGADTFSRLAVGANGTVLTADSAEATGLKWATAAGGGGFTLISTTTLSGTTTTISSISGSYKHLFMYTKSVTSTINGESLALRFNSDTGSNYTNYNIRTAGSTVTGAVDTNSTSWQYIDRVTDQTAYNKLGSASTWILRYTDTDVIDCTNQAFGHDNTNGFGQVQMCRYNNTAAITSISIISTGNLSGTVYLYGVS